jgi:hypothetical protein
MKARGPADTGRSGDDRRGHQGSYSGARTDAIGQKFLRRVAEYRAAARLAVQTKLEDRGRNYLALLNLADEARKEHDPTIRAWAERAIWEESKSFLGADDRVVIPESYERAQRRLRRQGLVRCPECASELATDMDLDRWASIRHEEALRLKAHEEAVGHD